MDGIAAARRQKAQLFWGEIAPCEHVVQIYEDNDVFFEALTKFVAEGLNANEGVIVIASSKHLNILEQRLAFWGIDIQSARLSNRFVVREADDVLAKFMVNDWPDRDLFRQAVTELLTMARGSGRKVRAFGEMVAIMWERGLTGATVNLEHLWHEIVQEEGFPLFCAYPKSGFTKDAAESLSEICAAHSKVLEESPFMGSLTPPGTDLRGALT